MATRIAEYFRGFAEAVGTSWNRFWFSPGDCAPLGVLRIAAGGVALYLHFTLLPDLVRLFGPDGLIPTELVDRLFEGPRPSYLNWFDSPPTLLAVHWIGGAVLLAFAAGLFTRVTSILALVVTLAAIHRAPLLAAEVEHVLAFTMFYLCLGPSGRCFSLDAWCLLRRGQAEPTVGKIPRSALATPCAMLDYRATIPTRLIQLHTALVYGMMGVTMLAGPNSTWWVGDAMWYLIARPESRSVDMTWIGDYPLLLNAWTHWVVLFELAFALLVWNRWARPLLLALSVPHWMALAAVSGRAPFCLLMIMLGAAFAPAAWFRPRSDSLPADHDGE